MAVNRYDRLQPWQGRFSSLPIEMLSQTLEKAQQQYDVNYLAADELRNQYVQALPQDQPRATEIEQQWGSQIDGIVQKYSGDYSQASKDLYKLQQEMKRAFLPGGEAEAIQRGYTSWQAELAKNKERLSKGEITPYQFQLFQGTLDKYQGVQKDPETGAYSSFSPVSLVGAVDFNKIATDAASKIKPREKTTSVPTLGADGYWKYETVTQSVVDPQAVYQSVADALMGDTQYSSYITQMAQLQGLDPQETLVGVIDAVAKDTAATYGGTYKDSREIKYEADPFVKQQREFAHDRQMAKMKYDRDVQLALAKGEIAPPASQRDNLALLAPTASRAMYKPVDPENQTIGGSFRDRSTQDVLLDAATPPGIIGLGLDFLRTGRLDARSMGNAALPPLTRTAAGFWDPPRKTTVSSVLNTPDQYKMDIDITLLKNVKSQYPNLGDADVWRIYNNSLEKQHYGEGIYYDKFATPEAQKTEADRVVPLLATGQLAVQKVDTKTGQVTELKSGEIIDLYNEYWDADKRRARIASPGRTVSQAGDVNVGTVLPPRPGKDHEDVYYVVADNSERMMEYNRDIRHRAFDFINEDRTVGDPVYWQEKDESGQVHTRWGVGVKEYIPSTDNAGNPILVPDVRYAAVDWEGEEGSSKWSVKRTLDNPLVRPEARGQIDYWRDEESGRIFTPAHMEARLLGDYRYKYFPVQQRTATKDYNNPIE